MIEGAHAETISVAVIDDHPLFLSGVSATVRDDPSLDLVGEGRNARDAWRIARCRRPHVMLVDVNLVRTDRSGLGLTEALSIFYPAVRVIMLSVEDGDAYLRRAFQAGASGYVSKAESADRVTAAIQAVAGGQTFWPSHFREDGQKKPWPTPAQLEVMRILVSRGHNKDVADVLGIAPATAEAHRLNLRRRLGFDTPVQMYRWLEEHELLRDDGPLGGSGHELGVALEAELDAELSTRA